MWGGDGSGWGQSRAEASGEVCKWEWLRDMAFVWWKVRTLVKVAKNESRD